MTILAQANSAPNQQNTQNQQTPQHPTPFVDIATRVIAAGIAPAVDDRGRRILGADGKPAYVARVTLALTPVKADQNQAGVVNLVNWPTEIGRLLPPNSDFELDAVPVGGDGNRTQPTAENPFGIKTSPRVPLRMKVRRHPLGAAELAAKWALVAGNPLDIADMTVALGTGKTSLDNLLRPPVTGAGATPDVHGSGRSAAAVELSLERAKQILDRLASRDTATRPPADDRLMPRVQQIMPLWPASGVPDASVLVPFLGSDRIAALRKTGVAIEEQVAKLTNLTFEERKAIRKEWIALAVRQALEDEDAWKELETSRKRADDTAQARSKYLAAKDAAEAVAALTSSDCHHGRRTPFDAAAAWGVSAAAPQGPQIKEAHAAHRLASQTPGPDGKDVELPADVNDPRSEFARRRFFALQTSPTLSRLFRFVVDLECPVERLHAALADATEFAAAKAFDVDAADRTAPEASPDAAPARFLLMRAQIQKLGAAQPRLPDFWCAAKFRWREGSEGAHFYPCTREEIDAVAARADVRNLAEQIDGLIDLGQKAECGASTEPRFDILTLDAITSTAADMHFEQSKAQDAVAMSRAKASGDKLPAEALDELSAQRRATLRTGGLALADRWRQNHAIARHRAAKLQYDVDPGEPALLDASDLTTGYKLDVGVKSHAPGAKARRYWHTLMRRTVMFKDTVHNQGKADPAGRPLDAMLFELYPDRLSRLRADDGILTVPAALRDVNAFGRRAAFAEEIVGTWRGDPLGLASGRARTRLDSKDLAFDMTMTLPKRTDGKHAEDFTPPPLRFGWRYHFGLRAVFAGGVSMPLERAISHYEKSYDGSLILPCTTQTGRSHRRHERIDAPRIAVPDWAFGKVTGADRRKAVKLQHRFGSEQALRMIVRTVADKENRTLLEMPSTAAEEEATSGMGIARRVLMVPPVTLDFAALHDALRNVTTEKSVTLYEPRVLRAGEKLEEGEASRPELVAGAVEGQKQQVWKEVSVAWRPVDIADRPRGGLKGIDYHAAWGGFPVFRMRNAIGSGIKPSKDAVVANAEGTVTDEGEILDRVDGLPHVKFQGKTVAIDWNAMAGNPSGDSVFRALPGNRKNEKERFPYYPDPATDSIVIEVTVRGASGSEPIRKDIKLVRTYAADPTGPYPRGYPDAMPVVLDVRRAAKGQPLIAFGDGGDNGKANYFKLSDTPREVADAPDVRLATPVDVRHVIVRLAPGEEATIRVWCLPRLLFLEHMFEGTEAAAALAVACGCLSAAALKDQKAIDEACQAGFKALCGAALPAVAPGAPAGPACGNLVTPSQPQIQAIAKLLHSFMSNTGPIPEIAAALEIEATHVIDLPLQAPAFVPANTPLRLLRTDDQLINTLLGDSDEAKKNPLYDPANWELDAQPADATGVLLAGAATLHGLSSGAVEIHASGAAAARGRFDDTERGRSRDDRARGLWPKPDGEYIKPVDLFGFEPQANGRVKLKRETVTLLRLEGFTPEMNRIELLAVQRSAATAQAARDAGNSVAESDRTLRALRPATFPDGRARHLDIFATAIARNSGVLRTRYDEVPDRLTSPAAPKPLARQWLPATVRPARIAPQSLLPSFRWTSLTCHSGLPNAPTTRMEVATTRTMTVRVRAQRPWFSSGEGERFGIVLWPPHLFRLKAQDVQQDVIRDLVPGRTAIKLTTLPDDGGNIRDLQDADLGPGGAWVTRWGGDPIRPGYPVEGWLLSSKNFGVVDTPVGEPDTTPAEDYRKVWVAREKDWDVPPERLLPDRAVVPDALMPVPSSVDSPELRAANPPGGFMSVALITYEARFDAEQELWYADVDIDALDVSYPFVRLGLVRFQPHAPRRLRVSEPIVEWIQIMPDRTLCASFDRNDARPVLAVKVKGPSSKRGESGRTPEASPAQEPLVRISLVRRSQAEDGTPVDTVVETRIAASSKVLGGLEWNISFAGLADKPDEEGVSWWVFAEEVELLRPATYLDEPRYGTRTDTEFAETGPRFAARLALAELWAWMRATEKWRPKPKPNPNPNPPAQVGVPAPRPAKPSPPGRRRPVYVPNPDQ